MRLRSAIGTVETIWISRKGRYDGGSFILSPKTILTKNRVSIVVDSQINKINLLEFIASVVMDTLILA